MLHPEDARKRRLGLALLGLATVVGLVLLCLFFVMLPVAVGQADLLGFMCLGAFIALPAGGVYLTVPRLLDRYDPEPAEVLFGCVVWGGIVSCGVAVTLNSIAEGILTTMVSPEVAEALATTMVAPVVEETLKGLGVLGVFHFLKREFDGLVDGVIYAFFVALGFAAVENVVYYARSAAEGLDQLTVVFVLRGVIAPWGHPVYTAMTGLGLGIAREAHAGPLRWLAPPCGFVLAVMLHALWNGGAVVSSAVGDESGAMLFCFLLSLWLVFVVIFAALVVGLVRRRRRTLATYLEQEVALRFVTPVERDLVLTRAGIGRARAAWGEDGDALVRTAGRLAMAKWHADRAVVNREATVSHELIAPYRRKLAELRSRIAARHPRTR